MQYSRTAVQFVEIFANENQNFFVRAVVAVPTIHLSLFSSLLVARMLSVSSSPVVVAQPCVPDCQSQSDENILRRSFLVGGRRPRCQCLH